MKTHPFIVLSFVALGLLTVPMMAQRGQGAGRGAGAGREPPGAGPSSGRSYQQPGPDRTREQSEMEMRRERQEQVAEPRAQNPEPPRVSLSERLQQETQLRRELGLTDKQEAALVRIREREQNEVRLINQKRLMTKVKKESRIRETMGKHSAEVRAVLTPEQCAKLDQTMDRDRDRDQDRDRMRDADRDRTRTQLSQPEKAQNP